VNAKLKSPRKPVQARAEETRARILQTAREHFAEHGFGAASVRDIAKDAGTTHSMIRYHFGSKDLLWREAVRDMFDLLRANVWNRVPRGEMTARDRLTKVTRLYARYCAQHPEHARITVAETIRGGDRLQWMVDEFVLRDHNSLGPCLQDAMDSGDLPQVPLMSLIYGYVGMMQLPFMLANEAKIAANYDYLSESAIEAHADAVLRILMEQRPARP